MADGQGEPPGAVVLVRGDPQQWCRLQGQPGGPFGGRESGGRPVDRIGADGLVADLNRDGGGAVHQLHRHRISGEMHRGAQNVVTGHQFGDGRGERGLVDGPPIPDPERRHDRVQPPVRVGVRLDGHSDLRHGRRVGVDDRGRQEFAVRGVDQRERATGANGVDAPVRCSSSAASRAMVCSTNTSRTSTSKPTARSAPTNPTARSESPPMSKKLSSTPTRSRPSASRKTPASRCSSAVRGATKDARLPSASKPGRGRAVLSSLPLAFNGRAGTTTTAAGTMYSGRVRRNSVRSSAGAQSAPAELRTELRRTLPEYMVPAAVVVVPALPLNANGKLDKTALPRPGFDALGSRASFVAPRTALEHRLAGVFRDALGLERVGVDDSFFDIGGDSLRAVGLVGALRAVGFEVDVRDVFVEQTIARLAALLEQRTGASTPFAPVAPFALIDPADRELLPATVVDAYPATMAQVGMAIEADTDPDRRLYTIVSSFRIRDRRPVDQAALTAAVAELVARHDILRTSVHLTGYSVPMQLVHRTATVPVQVRDQPVSSDSVDRSPAGLAAAERAAGLTLEAAPLLRVAANQDDGAWWLTLTISHLIVGGWDFNSLLADLVAGYRRLSAGDQVGQ